MSAEAEEQFYNFGFPGVTYTPGAVNGKQWQFPTVSAITQRDELDVDCSDCGIDKVRIVYSIRG